MRPGQQLAQAGGRVPGLQHLQPPRARPAPAAARGLGTGRSGQLPGQRAQRQPGIGGGPGRHYR